MIYTAKKIAEILGSPSEVDDSEILHLSLDSRKIPSPANTLFFALKGPRRNGHQFLADVYKKGVRNFVISEDISLSTFEGANFIRVNDSLEALQTLTSWHRSQFNVPVIGITGSNGKTIVKEWLYQLLSSDHQVVRSPKSFNSQIGVPLSVWQMNEHHTLAIFEAGISQPGEMDRLQRIIRPTIGVLTNIGEAHSEGFSSVDQKRLEKEILFKNARRPELLQLVDLRRESGATVITARQPQKDEAIEVIIPFTDEASVQNAITCWQVMLELGYENDVIKERIAHLSPVNMRLELKKAINHCILINDSYSADLSSLEIALGFMDQQGTDMKKTVIISDFLQSALKDEELYAQILDNLQRHHLDRVIGIGEKMSRFLRRLAIKMEFRGKIEVFATTDEYINQFRSTHFREEIILIKGARMFAFERIGQLLEQKLHQTVLEINLNAIAHNLRVYQQQLQPRTKVMAMVKAFAYGSGGAEIAGILQFHKVDYLGVAYADEGIELRNAGITLPIMVMNPEESVFESMVDYDLEPDIYSFHLLQSFNNFLLNAGIQAYPVHIEIETGMNRLGFHADEIPQLAEVLAASTTMKTVSIFSHLAASDDATQDEFSHLQFARYNQAIEILQEKIGTGFIRHIANSAAIFRLPQLQLDMVRLGIGLYGVDSAGTHQQELQSVATLRSTIAQIKIVKAGESVSYNRKAVMEKDSLIATVRIGYADGFSRRLGHGVGKILINKKLVPVIGTVCMDMIMVDVTDIQNVKEGDDVVIFGSDLPIQKVAAWAGTIAYEVMTGISQRVKRVYFEE